MKNKQKSQSILYFDTETTVLNDPDNCCAFFQLAGIIEKNGVEVDRFNYQLNPNNEYDYNEECLKFNDITCDDLDKFEMHYDVYDKFIALLDKHVNKYDKNDKLHLCGFNNISFDNQKLRNWFSGMDIRKDNKYNTFGSYFWSNTLDVFPYLSLVFINYRNLFDNFKLQTVAEKMAQMGIIDKKYLDSHQWHDALADVEATRDLFKFCLDAFSLNIFENNE